MKLLPNKRVSRLEVKAAPHIKAAVNEQKEKEEQEWLEELKDAHYWSYIDHFYPDVAQAARVALEPIGDFEEIDTEKMTPEGRIAWKAFQALGDSIPVDELNRYRRIHLADILDLAPHGPDLDERINVELEKRGLGRMGIGEGSHMTALMYRK